MRPSGFSHLEVTVTDLRRSLSFYRDLLGLRVFQEGTEQDVIGDVDYARMYERSDRTYRYAMLIGGSAVIVLIEPTNPPPSGASIKVDQVGITHFGLSVDDLDSVYEDLKSKGVRFVVPPHALMDTPLGVMRSAFAVDPDGILVQLDELVPAE
jgi:catechol 2,3-dioxygenase-like lactoylglutathione lyase family enzyme